MKLNCIVVEDSSLQRMIISKLVTNHPNLNLVGDFSNAIDARNCLTVYSIDVIFLDVEMPVINGFDFLDGLDHKPQVIFITSKSEYAIKAFDYEATDCIQKPVSVERFNVAVRKASEQFMLRQEAKDERKSYVFIKSNLKKLKLYTDKIKWVEAFGDYIKIFTNDEIYLVLSTMKAFENELPKEKFVRVHKSFIINIDKINHFDSKYAEIGKTKIPLSRNKKENLINALSVS